jgi:phosphoglycerol transferase MdoB-like AlkP superfamily enzyme
MSVWPLLAGLALALTGWLITRIEAKSRWRLSAGLALDILPTLVFFLIPLALTARPIFSGAVALGLMIGFAFVDVIKRQALLEPAVFSDIGEFVELFRHPQLYLPFAGPARVIAGAILAFALFVLLLLTEPPAFVWSPVLALMAPAGAIALGWLLHGRFIGWTANRLRGLAPTGDADRDARELGLSAMQLTYSLIARDERPARRLRANRMAPAVIVRNAPAAGPVIVAQSESFFDPRRLAPGLGQSSVAAFSACSQTGLQSGRLLVPGWGANTTRSEFAVLTGLSEEAIGFDRFNPYFAFARQKLSSLAWRMRAEGYRTICLHPFDRTFYRRDQVMLNLGFDVFLGEEAFAGAKRAGAYIADTEVARVAIDLMREEGQRLFLFAITMENHGPWQGAGKEETARGFPAPLAASSDAAALARYLDGLASSDAMLRMLTDALTEGDGSGLCAFYGDHLPSFPAAFAACGFTDPRSDYVIWRPGCGPALRQDLSAHQLGDAILTALQAPRSANFAVRL